ncbi:MAG: hypothetical protein WC735_00075 [Candidatus Paceibacterota bacterium]
MAIVDESVGSLTIYLIGKILTRARVGGASVVFHVADLPSKKLSLQKIFGSNLSLHGRVASGNPFPHYAELRSARENFGEKSLSLITECLLNSARTYFTKNSGEMPNLKADSVLRKHFLGKQISQNLG